MATPAANIATVVIATTVHPKRELGWPCVASAVENPEHKPGRAVGFRGGRYISAEASARGEWKPGGSKMPDADALIATRSNPLGGKRT